MTGSVIVTGKIGPGVTLTTKTFSDVRRATFDFEHGVLQMIIGPNLVSQSVELSDTSAITAAVVTGTSIAFTMTNA